MAVRTILRRYPYGTSFGGPPMPGAFTPLSTFTDPRAKGTTTPGDMSHPYFTWMAQKGKTYGQDSYAEWVSTLPAGSSAPPTPPPMPEASTEAGAGWRAKYASGVDDPNDPANPNYIPPSPGGGAVYIGRDANGTQFIWKLPDGRTFTTDQTGKVTTQPVAGAPAAAGAGAGAGAGAAPADSTAAIPTSSAGAAQSPAGGSGPSVGQSVTGQTSKGVSVSGQIVSSANGQTTVRWADGTVSTYDSGGQLLSTSPPAPSSTGAAAGAGAVGAGAGAVAPAARPATPATSTTGEVYTGPSADQGGPTPNPAVAPGTPPGFGEPAGAGVYQPTPAPAPANPAVPSGAPPGFGEPAGSTVVAAPTQFADAQGNMVTLDQLMAQTFQTLATTPPPNTNFTIPPSIAVQLPPLVDTSNIAAGFAEPVTDTYLQGPQAPTGGGGGRRQ